MGHEKVDTTEDYVKFAKQYYCNAPYDWIRAVLNFCKTNTEFLEQQKGTSKNTADKIAKKGAAASVVSPVGVNAPVGIRTRV